MKLYSIVEFVNQGRKRKRRQVDVVPSTWIEFNKSRNKGTTKFLSTIKYEESKLLHDLVRKLSNPPENWTSYSVIILGEADTYENAMEQIKQLEVDQHVFSLESSQELEDRQCKILEEVKRRMFLKEEAELDNVLQTMLKQDKSNDISDTSETEENPQNHNTSEVDLSDNASSESLYEEKELIDIDEMPVKPKYEKYCTTDAFDNPSLSAPLGCKNNSQNEVGALTDGNNELLDITNLKVPVINISDVQCASNFEITVLQYLSNIYVQQQEQSRRLDILEKYICGKSITTEATNLLDFESKYNFRLPIEDKETFIKFNKDLELNKYMKKDVIAILKTCMDEKNYVITKSMLTMIRKFVSKSVVMQYTAARKSSKEEKDIFKLCKFYSVMEYVIVSIRNEKNLESNHKALTKGLSDVLCNAMYWDVKRSKKIFKT